MAYKGTKGPVLISEQPSFTVGQGWNNTRTYHGGELEINGLADELILEGYEFDIVRDPPYSVLYARKQTEFGNDESYVDRYKFHKESIDREIWTLDAVQAEAAAYGDAAAYRKWIDDAIASGDETPMVLFLPIATYPTAWKVLTELSRGATHYEDEYLVLTRERVISAESVRKLDISNTKYIYTTTQLINVFGVPNFSNVLMPAQPSTTPAATKWGWRSRQESVHFIEGNKVQLVEDWAYAAWSTNQYTPYS